MTAIRRTAGPATKPGSSRSSTSTRAAAPDWQQADVWFCGPTPFGEALRADLVAQGLPAARFHQELFAMR